MQLPIDVKALIDEMTDIEAARNTPLSVSVFIDEAAPADLAAHVRNAFASTMPSVRMTVSYLDDTFMPHPTDAVAVIAAVLALVFTRRGSAPEQKPETEAPYSRISDPLYREQLKVQEGELKEIMARIAQTRQHELQSFHPHRGIRPADKRVRVRQKTVGRTELRQVLPVVHGGRRDDAPFGRVVHDRLRPLRRRVYSKRQHAIVSLSLAFLVLFAVYPRTAQVYHLFVPASTNQHE